MAKKKEETQERQHAILSPSSAKRWMSCPASAKLEDAEPEQETKYTEEGTLAHAYCAKLIKGFLGLDTKHEDEEIEALKQYYSGEMGEHTQDYKSIVLEKYTEATKTTPDAKLFIETKLDFNTWIPEGFGTADAIIISDGTMEVIDFKYGAGVKVSVWQNPQMMIYALGALELYDADYDIREVKMTIVQPRMDNVSEYTISVEQLLAWAVNILRPQAMKAYEDDAEQVPGDHCQFCKVRHKCTALAKNALQVYFANESKTLGNEQLNDLLKLVPLVKTWLSGLEDYALTKLMAGERLSSWKIVEGRSIRKITDTIGVMKELAALGYNEDQILKPRELVSLTELEKMVGKKIFAEKCGQYISKPQGKPTLAPVDDKREAFNSTQTDFQDFQ